MWPNHVLLAWGGDLGNPAMDVWTNTLKLVVVGGAQGGILSPDDQFAFANEADALLKAWHSTSVGTAAGPYHLSAKLQWIKCNSIGADGRYVNPVTTEIQVATPPSGVATHPNWRQTAAITLRTAQTRGPAHVGRFYPAGSNYNFDGTGDAPYFSAAAAQSVADAAVTLIEGLNAIDINGDGSVMLQVSCVAQSTPAYPNGRVLAVQGVEVDRVFDTQKRRTNRVPRLSESSAVTL